MGINIALDGPSGAGKSTIARLAAKKLGYLYVDTGAMYRAIAYHMLSIGTDISDEAEVSKGLEGLKVSLKHNEGVQSVLVNDEDVSDKIRTNEVSMAASCVSKYSDVRAFLLDTQRTLAKENNVIMDGRDIGTVVLPDANVKIFLTASAQERANRRFKELQEKGDTHTYEEILADINERDYNDSHREIAPLKQAEDATLIDSTSLSVDEVVDKITELAARADTKEVKKNERKHHHRELIPLRPITKTHRINPIRQFLYTIVRVIVRFIFKCWYDLSYEGLENVPRDGGNIFASNHRSYGDPVFIALMTRVPISYMAKEELFKQNIFFTWLIKFWGAFPVVRGTGDTAVIDTSIEKLEMGRNLVIFPEGTRSRDGKVGKGKTGVALVAAVAQTKVIPVGINFDGRKLHRGTKVVVRYGKPIYPSELGVDDTSSQNLKKLKKEIMNSITDLVH